MTRCFRVVDLRVSIFILFLFSIFLLLVVRMPLRPIYYIKLLRTSTRRAVLAFLGPVLICDDSYVALASFFCIQAHSVLMIEAIYNVPQGPNARTDVISRLALRTCCALLLRP